MKTKKTAPHSALRSRIKTLGVRTVALKRQMLAAGASHRISRLAQAADLELRHNVWQRNYTCSILRVRAFCRMQRQHSVFWPMTMRACSTVSWFRRKRITPPAKICRRISSRRRAPAIFLRMSRAASIPGALILLSFGFSAPGRDKVKPKEPSP
jgi:hypothetical protein